MAMNPYGTRGDPRQEYENALRAMGLSQGVIEQSNPETGQPTMGWGTTDEEGNFRKRFLPQSDQEDPTALALRKSGVFNRGSEEYVRISVDPQTAARMNPELAPYLGQVVYDEQSGYGVPMRVMQELAQTHNVGEIFGIPEAIVTSFVMAGGPVTAGLALGAGAGLEAGAAGLTGDALGLAQMGQAAGLSGSALEGFIASGGTLGSTAAGGGGIGFGASQFGGASYGNAPGIGEGSFQNVSAEGFTGEGYSWEDMLRDAGIDPSSTQFSSLTNEQLASMGLDPAGGGSSFLDDLLQRPPSGNIPENDPSFQVTNEAGGPLTQTTNAPGGLGGTAGASSSALKWLSEATGIPEGALSALGTLGATGLGIAGSNAQSGALQNMQNQYLALGAPSRARLEASYAPGFSIWNDPATRDAGTRAADIAARSYSASGGNPFGNPSAQSGIYQNVLSSVGLPQLNTYRSQNASSGQLGLNTAGTASAGLANSSDNLYNSLGYGLNALTGNNNNNNLTGILAGLQRQLQLNNGGLV